MYIVKRTLWIVIFMILISETSMNVKRASYSKEYISRKNNILNFTLKNHMNTVRKEKLNFYKEYLVYRILPGIFFIFGNVFLIHLTFYMILHYCPLWLLNHPDEPNVFDYVHVYRQRFQSNQPRIRQLNHYDILYTRDNESVEDDEDTDEND